MMPRSKSRAAAKILRLELAWLAYFLGVFVAAVYLLLRSLVPHHFNDKVAIMLAAIFSGLILIGTRALISAKWRRE
jgi:hypothetical protein